MKLSKKGPVDLHVHTSFSDGILEPDQIVSEAVKLGLVGVAITDHDCIDGISGAVHAAADKDIEVIPGVELSVYIEDKEVHLLGYFIDVDNTQLREFLSKMKEGRKSRLLKILGLLDNKGIRFGPDVFEKEKDKGTIGRMNIARALVENGFVPNIKAAFDKYIGDGKSCCVKHSKISFEDGVNVIKSSGGVPVLAHPGTIGDMSYVNKCIAAGIRGMETYHPKHKPYQVLRFENIARDNGLICTGGSDCHGRNIKNSLLLGTVTVDYRIVDELKQQAG